MMEKIKKVIKNPKVKNVLVPLIICLIYIITLIVRNGIVYDTNDDVAMRAIASGAYADKPLPHMFFSCFPYSVILTGLFTIIPQIDWYGTVLLLLTFLYIFFTIYYITKNVGGVSKKAICTMLLLCFFSAILPAQFIRPTFTKVAGFLAACSLILYLLPSSKVKNILIVIGLIFAFSIRRKACLMFLIFFFSAYIYKNWGDKEALKKDFIFGATIAIMLVVCFFVEKVVIYHYEGWNDYYEYNKSRLPYFDYYSDELTKLPEEKIKEIYYEAGISDNEFATLQNYHITFSDELRYKLPKLIEICKEHGIEPKAKIVDSMKKLFINRDGEIFIISLALIIITFGMSKEKKKFLIKTGLLVVFEVAILAGLIYNSRIVQRVYEPLYFGLISFNLIVLFDELRNREKIKEFFKTEKLIVLLPVCIAVCICFFFAITRIYISKEYRDRVLLGEEIYEYIQERPENLYLFNRHNEEFYYFFNKYSFSNYLTLGGWSVYSPVYTMKLHTRNANTVKDLIFRENVYVVLSDQVNVDWYRYLDENMHIEECDRVSNYIIYKFSR